MKVLRDILYKLVDTNKNKSVNSNKKKEYLKRRIKYDPIYLLQ